MRTLFWALAILGLALALTLAAKYNTGYVLLVYPPYRAELSLSFMIFLLLAAFSLAYGLLRLGISTLKLPEQVRAFREQKHKKQIHASMLDGMKEFAAGHYAKAENLAAGALEQGEEVEINALVAARSAHALQAYNRRDAYLAQVGKACSDYPESGMANE